MNKFYFNEKNNIIEEIDINEQIQDAIIIGYLSEITDSIKQMTEKIKIQLERNNYELQRKKEMNRENK